MPSIYLINPLTAVGSYHTAEGFNNDGRRWVQVADLAIVTVAAMVPKHWQVEVVDEFIDDVNLWHDADFIGITGKYSQRDRMIELANHFRSRGKTVLIGGPYATLSVQELKPHADILVTGEIEEIADALFADLEKGDWSSLYTGGRADITRSPVPRWDLYPVERALVGAIQTTRGCPFNCEFCDVIQYQGRKQRHKSNQQIVDELDALYREGVRQIFIVDDNFTVHRQQVHAVLDLLIDWNARHAGDRVRFQTQASLDVAREDELLRKCKQAGVETLFVGIETMNPESLRESGKRQNLLMPMKEAIDRIVAHGLAIQAGIIVGFDHDSPAIFEEMLEFLQACPLPDVAIGPLMAPQSTDLYRRLRAAGRITGESWDVDPRFTFSTNVIPAQMSREDLLYGVDALTREAFSARRFEQRLMNLIERFGEDQSSTGQYSKSSAERGQLFMATLRRIGDRGLEEKAMVSRVLRAAGRKPAVLPTVMQFLGRYENTRSFLDGPPANAGTSRGEIEGAVA